MLQPFRGEWWTRNEHIRTQARLPVELALRLLPGPVPVYQRIAAKAACMRRDQYSVQAIAFEIGVAHRTAAKAIRWYEAGGRFGS